MGSGAGLGAASGEAFADAAAPAGAGLGVASGEPGADAAACAGAGCAQAAGMAEAKLRVKAAAAQTTGRVAVRARSMCSGRRQIIAGWLRGKGDG